MSRIACAAASSSRRRLAFALLPLVLVSGDGGWGREYILPEELGLRIDVGVLFYRVVVGGVKFRREEQIDNGITNCLYRSWCPFQDIDKLP